MAVVMAGAWLIQRRTDNPGWIDVFWTSGTGVACVSGALIPADVNPVRQGLVAAMAGIWSVRLGTYLARRVARSPEDRRYVGLRRQWGGTFESKLLRFVMWQPPVSVLLALAVLAAACAQGPIGLRDLAGFALLAISIVGEAIADEQMRRYRRNSNRPEVMDRGLWGLSRHPNYFFEWLTWLAFPVIAFVPASPASWLSLPAPAVMYLVLRYGTGVPMLEKAMLAGKGEAYRDYQMRVSAFFPASRRKLSNISQFSRGSDAL